MNGNGVLITLEGCEATGKSTQIDLLKKYIENTTEYDVITTREPGGTPFGDAIREMVKYNPICNNITPMAELLLFEASRSQLIHDIIKPALDADNVVICDRYIHSSLAYQGWGKGIPVNTVNTLNHYAIEGTYPDITFILDIDPITSFERIKIRGEKTDRIEQENIEFHNKVRSGYLSVVDGNSYIYVIDASQSIEDVSEEIIDIISKLKI